MRDMWNVIPGFKTKDISTYILAFAYGKKKEGKRKEDKCRKEGGNKLCDGKTQTADTTGGADMAIGPAKPFSTYGYLPPVLHQNWKKKMEKGGVSRIAIVKPFL